MKIQAAVLAMLICTSAQAVDTLALQTSKGDLFIEIAGKRCHNGDQPLATFMNHNLVSDRVHLTGCVIDADMNYITVRYTHSKGRVLVPAVIERYPSNLFTRVKG